MTLPIKFPLKLGAKQEIEVVKKELLNPTTMLESAASSNFEVATIMAVQTTSTEEQIANLMKVVEELMKHIQEQDSQITKLMNKVDNADTSRLMGKQIKAHDETETSMKQQSSERDVSSKELQVSSDGLILID